MPTEIQTAALLANFAELTYHPNGTPPAGWELIPKIGTAVDGSFAAYAYRNTTTGQIVIAYAGTNGLGDWTGANIPILTGGAGNQLTPAADFAKRIRDANPGADILVTGHSLGGALAQVISTLFGFDGAAMDPLAAASILSTPEFLALTQTYGKVGMPNTFTNFGVTQSVVSGGTGTQLGAMLAVPSLGFSLLDFVGTAVAATLNPILGFFTAIGLDQVGKKHASAQIAQALDLMANAVNVDKTATGGSLFTGAVSFRARTEQVFNSATGQTESHTFTNEIEFVNANGQVLSTGIFSGELDNRKLEVYAPGATVGVTVPSVTCVDTSRAGDANLMDKGDLICYAPDNSVTIIDMNTGAQIGELQGSALAPTAPTTDFLAQLAEFRRIEGVDDGQAIVNASEVRSLVGAQGANEAWGGGDFLKYANGGVADFVNFNEQAPTPGANYLVDIGAIWSPGDISRNLGLLPTFSLGQDNAFCTADYDSSTLLGGSAISANSSLATGWGWSDVLAPATNTTYIYAPTAYIPPSSYDPYLYTFDPYAYDPYGLCFPIVLDLDGDGVELIKKQDSHAYYDVKGDGFRHNIGWVGADDGLLAIDKNNDGKIDQADELSFALWTADPNDTDVDGLSAVFDTNHDGKIDSADARFNDLRIWQDANGDGVSDAGELKTLAERSITSISLDVARTEWASGGNRVQGFTTYQNVDGSTGFAADVALGYEAEGWKASVTSNLVTVTRSGGLVYGLAQGVPLTLDLGVAGMDGAIGGAGNDVLSAGTRVAVMLEGGDGNDTITGGSGDDLLKGGSGSDVLSGGAGDDTLLIDAADLQANINGGDGFDVAVVTGTAGVALNLAPANLESAIGGDGNDTFSTSGTGQVILAGQGGNDTLTGGANNDLLTGGAGNDTLTGGKGNDVYVFGRGDGVDQITDETSGYVSQTTVVTHFQDDPFGSPTYAYHWEIQVSPYSYDTLADKFNASRYNYFLTHSHPLIHDIVWTGISQLYVPAAYRYWSGTTVYQEDVITQVLSQIDAGSDTLRMGLGVSLSDVVLEKSGADLVVGLRQAGVAVSDLADRVTLKNWSNPLSRIEYLELADGTRYALADWQIGTAGNDNLVDGAGDGHLYGGSGNDALNGASGNDSLDGGTGADSMAGGTGDDVYMVDNAGDVVSEYLNEGTDRVESSVAFTLTPNVENLTLIGSAAINGTGTDLANTIVGNGADNSLSGGGGNDILQGGAGNDRLDGGAGTDSMAGGTGNDTYVVDNAGDVITENAGEGTDAVESSFGYTLGANLENLLLTGNTAIDGTGNTLANVLTGNAGSNVLDGGAGADTMIGGVGEDIYVVDNAADVVVEYLDEGWDTVLSSLSYALGSNIENLKLTGMGVIDATGNDLDNSLTGNALANTLTGGAGYDTLDGGAGADIMAGGTEDDTYVVDNIADVVVENADEGYSDRVESSVSYTLGANVEDITLTGMEAIDATGNDLDNYLVGNDSANVLTGGAGDDHLKGGAGADTMIGGTGSDYYYVDNAGDIVIENAGEGDYDEVRSKIGYTLGADVENLSLRGMDAIDGTGNSLDNWLGGNDSANVLVGLAGNDTLDGGAGADTMVGGAGDDTYYVDDAGDIVTENADEGYDGVESAVSYALGDNVERMQLAYGAGAIDGTGNGLDNSLYGNESANVLRGGAGNDTLNGRAGADTMVGGAGDDTYYVDDAGDSVAENAGDGSDTVVSDVGYTLGENLENLALNYGAGAINGTGNSLDNFLYGNESANVFTGLAGNDTLDGSAGADAMVGGAGDDTYYVDDAGDSVAENAGEGSDTVVSDISYTLGENLEDLALNYGAGAITGTGNGLDNYLHGNELDNVLTGLAGNDTLDGFYGFDTLIGGTGDDTYVVSSWYDTTNDTVVENANEGTDTVQSYLNYTLAANVENLTSIGDGLSLTGNNLGNLIKGDWGGNRIDGGAGADTMVGYAGDDVYVVDNAGDVVTEYGSFGTDTVESSVSYALGDNVENLILTGTAALIGTGNEMDNVLTGNSANNTLAGGAGNDILQGGAGSDRLDGGTGADNMVGGTGNDTYVVDNAGDVITENAGEGTDTVESNFAQTLGANLENLLLTGNTAINGTGTELNNLLSGNGGNNVLMGLAGNDSLSGGTGVDTLIGGTGDDGYYLSDGATDTVIEFANEGTDTVSVGGVDAAGWAVRSYVAPANVENLRSMSYALTLTGNGLNNVLVGDYGDNWLWGSDGNDRLEGLDGNDRLDGGAGADTMIGGAGNDTFVVDNAGDIVTENANDGLDTVKSSISYTLVGTNVEMLYLLGTAAINATGNADRNVLAGNSANNVLDGGMGNDILQGFAGDDTYVVDNAGDAVMENATEGMDTVQSSINYALGSNVENLTLTGTAALSGTGNNLNNKIVGNSANNMLQGDATGYAGNAAPLANLVIYAKGTPVLGVFPTMQVWIDGALVQEFTVDAASYSPYTVAPAKLGMAAHKVDVVFTNDAYRPDLGEDRNLFLQKVVANDQTINATDAGVYLDLGAGAGAFDGFNVAFSGGALGGNSSMRFNLDGSDVLDGGAGADTLTGGFGNDTYVVDNAGDLVTELANGGDDLVKSSIDWTLGANIEHLMLTGTTAVAARGNELDNLIRGNASTNLIVGGAGNDCLEGGGGIDVLDGGSGNDVLRGSITNALLSGGAGNDTLWGGNGSEFYIGGNGNDSINPFSGLDIIAFNRGDGRDAIAASTGADNTISIGGGIRYRDLAFRKSANDLILDTGAGEQITLQGWYAAAANKSVVNLQMIEEAAADFDAASADPLLNNKIEQFNFAGLAGRFDQALAATPTLTSWSLTNALLDFHIGDSDTAALGGDLAYQYGKAGSLAAVGLTAAQGILGSASFGSAPQALLPQSSLQVGVALG